MPLRPPPAHASHLWLTPGFPPPVAVLAILRAHVQAPRVPILPLSRLPHPLATTTPSFCCCLCPHRNPLGTCCPPAILLHIFLLFSPSLRWSISIPALPWVHRRWPPHPNVWCPQIPPPWRSGASLARGALLCVSARSGFPRGRWTMRNYRVMARGQCKCDFPVISLPGSNKSLVSLRGRCCRSSQRGGLHPADGAVGTTRAPNRLLALRCGVARASCQNSCRILFYTDKNHLLLQPHSQKSLNHFSWNFPKKVSPRLTPCKGYFSQNSLSLAKL